MLLSMNIEPPECRVGYTVEQLERILGDRIKEFYIWMRGQTFSSCDDRIYNHSTKEYEPGCGPHGFVYYPWDVQRFLDGSPIVD